MAYPREIDVEIIIQWRKVPTFQCNICMKYYFQSITQKAFEVLHKENIYL